ncbi:MAG: hypothetical protein GX638_00605 [Crenarchaeota archaeon]|nr:hypothetical protein [Thermoproteota archaeon]
MNNLKNTNQRTPQRQIEQLRKLNLLSQNSFQFMAEPPVRINYIETEKVELIRRRGSN